MGLLKFIFGAKKQEVQNYLNDGAIILDVRTRSEWNNGHIKNAMHIPLDQLKHRHPEVSKLNKPVVVVCETGVRSGSATRFLKLKSINAVNGGGWKSLNERISQ